MEWVPVLFGFLGFGIAGLSLYFSYKERKAEFRNALYKKQIEVYEEIVENINKLYYRLTDFLSKSEIDQINFNLKSIKKETGEIFVEFMQKYDKWILFSSKEVIDSIRNNIDIYFEVVDYAENSPGAIDKIQINVFIDSIATASSSVKIKIRRALGTEPLSDETLKMFGEMPKQLKREIEQEEKSTQI